MNFPKELKNYRIRPSKRLGQHFLINQAILKKIIEAAELKKIDIVLEIGPGTGILTKELAKTAKKVIAIEKDPRLCQILKESLKRWNVENVEIVNKDALKIENWEFIVPLRGISRREKNWKLKIENYKVVANLPYYITSPVIRKFLESENPPKLLVLMVQKEVAKRICASPPKMNLLALSAQFYAKAEIIGYVSKKSFWPQPKVDSAIIRITPLINAGNKRINADKFFKIVKAGFSHPRKKLVNNLAKELKIEKEEIKKQLEKININPEQRAENLSLGDWQKLAKIFKSCA